MGLALDLGNKGIACLVLDHHDGAGMGRHAICVSTRTLEICGHLGCGDPIADKGVVWNLGASAGEDKEIYAFNLRPEKEHKHPAFIYLQQLYFEQFIVSGIRYRQNAGAPIEICGQKPCDRNDAPQRSCCS